MKDVLSVNFNGASRNYKIRNIKVQKHSLSDIIRQITLEFKDVCSLYCLIGKNVAKRVWGLLTLIFGVFLYTFVLSRIFSSFLVLDFSFFFSRDFLSSSPYIF